MFCAAELLWEKEEFIGHSYPPDVCLKMLKSMELLSSLNPAGTIRDMTAAEFSVLCCAADFPKKHEGEQAAVAELAALLGVSVPAVSRSLRGLQKKNLIERKIDELDRRSIRVLVTASGRESLDSNLRLIIDALNRIMSVFTQDEVRTIAELYSKFAEAAAKSIVE